VYHGFAAHAKQTNESRNSRSGINQEGGEVLSVASAVSRHRKHGETAIMGVTKGDTTRTRKGSAPKGKSDTKRTATSSGNYEKNGIARILKNEGSTAGSIEREIQKFIVPLT
jgi:hypothetical protein